MCQKKVGGCGQLDVLPVSLHQRDGYAEGFYHRSIIGEVGREGLLVGLTQDIQLKYLWGLYQPVVVSRYGTAASLGEKLSDGLHHRQYRHSSADMFCLVITSPQSFSGHERTHPVMHCHHGL